jgi:anti-sigma factor RsiW
MSEDPRAEEDHGTAGKMSSEEARGRLVDAADGSLGDAEARAFEAALAADADLRADYDELRAAMGELDAAKRSEGAGAARRSVDVLARVQGEIASRSGGRFYRDRFSRLDAGSQWMRATASAGVALVIFVVWVYFAFLR